jgi:aminopeptidase YwaD
MWCRRSRAACRAGRAPRRPRRVSVRRDREARAAERPMLTRKAGPARRLRSALRLAAISLAALTLTAAAASLSAQEESTPAASDELLDPALRDLFHEALSGELAKEHLIEITRHHRIQGSRGYREAAQYVMGRLGGFGFVAPTGGGDAAAGTAAGGTPGTCRAGDPPTAWVESFVSDGHAMYQTWQSPPGWDIDSAELRLLPPRTAPAAGAPAADASATVGAATAGATGAAAPAGAGDGKSSADAASAGERIVGFPEIAMSVMTYSNAGDVTAPLVWVGSGDREEDYAGKDVRGKFVLATGYGGAVHRLAVLAHGAAAVVCFLDDSRAADHPDMLQYTGMWPHGDELSRTTFGFNLTHRQGARLRDMLLAGQDVTLHGWVKGRGLEPYFMDVVCAVIPGSEHPEEELVFSAHLDHPKESANDNASGSGAILDMARTLKELIDSGRLPRPRRTLRFLWVPEWNGTMAYIDRHPELCGPELGGHVLANLNMDMVGENLELLHSRLILTRTPDSLPSCLNDVVQNMAEMVDAMDIRTPRGGASAFNWRMTPYSGGSDHMMMIDRKIPAIMFSHSPDYTHHTSDDTPDKVDPVELERCELISTGAAWYLANLTDALALDLAALAGAGALTRAGEAMRLARAVEGSDTDNVIDPLPTLRALQARLGIASESVASVLSFHAGEDVDRTVKHWRDELGAMGDRLWPALSHRPSAEPPAKAEAGDLGVGRRVHRLTRGPLDFGLPESRLTADDITALHKAAPFDGDMRFELVNFIDDQRHVANIAAALSTEFRRKVTFAQVTAYIDALVKVGVVEWQQ